MSNATQKKNRGRPRKGEVNDEAKDKIKKALQLSRKLVNNPKLLKKVEAGEFDDDNEGPNKLVIQNDDEEDETGQDVSEEVDEESEEEDEEEESEEEERPPARVKAKPVRTVKPKQRKPVKISKGVSEDSVNMIKKMLDEKLSGLEKRIGVKVAHTANVHAMKNCLFD